MRLSDEALDEFVALYKKEFKKTITKTEASETASRLLTLYELLARPLLKKQIEAPGTITQPDDTPQEDSQPPA